MHRAVVVVWAALAAPAWAQQTTPFIIGGEDASGRWPWAALIDVSGPVAGLCSGLQLTPRWVLTAAHCLFAEDSPQQAAVSDVGVILGSSPLGGWTTEHPIAGYWIPASYTEFGSYQNGNDIALLQLSTPVPNGAFPSIVDQRNQDDLEALDALGRDEALSAIGWGVTRANADDIPGTLQEVALDYVPFATCDSAWSGQLDAPSMLCAAELNPIHQQQDTCFGDSGGPLFIGTDHYPYVVGLTSFGDAKCAGTRPTVYTRLIGQVAFIENMTRQAGDPLVDLAFPQSGTRLYAPLGQPIDVPVRFTNASLANPVTRPRVRGTVSNARVHYDIQWGLCSGEYSGDCEPVAHLAAGSQSPAGSLHASAVTAAETHDTLVLTLGADETDYRTRNDRHEIDLIFSDRPDLIVTGDVTHIGYNGANGEAEVAVTVRNGSTVADAGAVSVALDLPASTTLSASSHPCDTDCALGPLARGANRTLTLTLTTSTPYPSGLFVTASNTDGGDFPSDNNQRLITLTYPERGPTSSGGGGGALAPWLLPLLLLATRRTQKTYPQRGRIPPR